jgi:hypothetical protein
MGVRDHASLSTHLKCGASWEGFALEQVIRLRGASPEECFFWGVHEQGEIDLLVQKGGSLEAFEFKYSSVPEITKSMRLALEILPIGRIQVVAPVEQPFDLSDKVRVVPLRTIGITKA